MEPQIGFKRFIEFFLSVAVNAYFSMHKTSMRNQRFERIIIEIRRIITKKFTAYHPFAKANIAYPECTGTNTLKKSIPVGMAAAGKFEFRFLPGLFHYGFDHFPCSIGFV